MANEKRLIDANALKVKGFADHDTGEGIVLVEDIDKAPTVDAVEVVRGRWEHGGACDHVPRRIKNPEKWVIYKCSICGYSNGRKQSNYCPNCGASMMDGERKEG